MTKRILAVLFLVLGVAPAQAANTLSASTALNDYSGSQAATIVPINTPDGLAYDFVHVLDVGQRNANSLSAVVTHSSHTTFSAVAFTTASYTLNNSSIAAATHGWPLGLAVKYSTTADSVAISPLVTGTTYYVSPITADIVALSYTSTNAVAGQYIALVSSSVVADQSYSLTPYVTQGSAVFNWTVSNDGTNYADFATAVSSTVASYTGGPVSQSINFSEMNFRYLKLAITAPTSGAMSTKVSLHVKTK